jgi:peptide/nickel transport system permease protein
VWSHFPSRQVIALGLKMLTGAFPLFAFIISRILQALPVMLTVALISFAMFAYVGDPVAIMLGQDFTEAQRQALVQDLGLDRPFWVQFGTFIGNAVQGEFGLSYRLSRPVSDLIA